MDPIIVVFGFCVGLLVGMTGIGGGSIMTPLLILVVGVKPVTAIGTDLFYAAVTKTLGGWRHFRQGTVDQRISAWLAAGSVPGALGGVAVLARLHAWYGKDFDKLVLFIVAGALALTGVATLGRAMFMRGVADRERDTVDLKLKHKVAAVTMGLFIGFLLGISSAGSGALIAVGLIMVFRLTPRRVVGTDVFHAAILLWVASFAHILSGNVDFGLAGNLLVGSLPGVWIGSSASVRVSPAILRPALGVVLCTASLGILIKADVGVPKIMFVIVPLTLALVAWRLPIARERGAARRHAATAPAPAEPQASLTSSVV
jgi:uncharacterized membrane protein YfcA